MGRAPVVETSQASLIQAILADPELRNQGYTDADALGLIPQYGLLFILCKTDEGVKSARKIAGTLGGIRQEWETAINYYVRPVVAPK